MKTADSRNALPGADYRNTAPAGGSGLPAATASTPPNKADDRYGSGVSSGPIGNTPYSPGTSDYQPGKTGFTPPNTPAYQPTGGNYVYPGQMPNSTSPTADQGEFRPGSTKSYTPPTAPAATASPYGAMPTGPSDVYPKSQTGTPGYAPPSGYPAPTYPSAAPAATSYPSTGYPATNYPATGYPATGGYSPTTYPPYGASQ